MKIKIISDGLPKNTKIINQETGEIIEHVRSIKWECAYDSLATAIIEFVNIPVEIEHNITFKKENNV